MLAKETSSHFPSSKARTRRATIQRGAGYAGSLSREEQAAGSAGSPDQLVRDSKHGFRAVNSRRGTSAREQINKQNAGIGTVRRFTDNETAKHLAVMRSQASESFIKGLFLPQKPDLWDIHLRTKGFTMEPDERTDIKP